MSTRRKDPGNYVLPSVVMWCFKAIQRDGEAGV